MLEIKKQEIREAFERCVEDKNISIDEFMEFLERSWADETYRAEFLNDWATGLICAIEM